MKYLFQLSVHLKPLLNVFYQTLFMPRQYLKELFIIVIVVTFTQCKQPVNLPAGDPGNGGLFIPEGFEAVVVTDSIGHARHIAVNTNGDIYVKLRFIKDGLGGNVALRDTNSDGKADIIKRFGDYKDEGSLANGM